MPQSSILSPCADPGFFFSRGGGGGGGGGMPESVFSPQLNLQFAEGVKWFYFKENCTFSKDPEGFQHFPGGGGVQLFPGGGGGVPNANF